MDPSQSQQKKSTGQRQTADKNSNQPPGQDVLDMLEQRKEYLHELSEALIRLDKGKGWWRRLFEEKAERVYGRFMSEEKIVGTIGKEILDLLSDVKKVITAYEQIQGQLKDLQLQLGKAKAEKSWFTRRVANFGEETAEDRGGIIGKPRL